MRDMIIVTTCPICGKETEIEVNSFDYLAWNEGKLIQNAFPYLTAEEREMIKTGICEKCWDNMFGIEEPDEEEDEDFDGDFLYDEDELDDITEEDIDAVVEWLFGRYEQ